VFAFNFDEAFAELLNLGVVKRLVLPPFVAMESASLAAG
jgi:hypothetical protein